MLYNGLNIIMDAFEKQVFEYGGYSRIDVGYGLTNKELQMFKKILNMITPTS